MILIGFKNSFRIFKIIYSIMITKSLIQIMFCIINGNIINHRKQIIIIYLQCIF